MDYRAIQEPVRFLLQDTDHILASYAHGNGRLISELRKSTPVAKGKKIRAAFFFLLAGLNRLPGNDLPRLAAAIEMLHLSSLVHDDIVDNSSRRRGEKTPNQNFGNSLSVLWGDYLFIHALRLLDGQWRGPAMDMMLDVSRQMIEGQILEFENSFNYDIPSRVYYTIIRKKTSSMFAGIAGLVAHMSGGSDRVAEKYCGFGRDFGMIFQISDDLLDIFSDRAGKDRFQDLKEGKVTLPYILLARRGALPLIKNFSSARPQPLLDRCRELEIKRWSIAVIDRYYRKCVAFLASFPRPRTVNPCNAFWNSSVIVTTEKGLEIEIKIKVHATEPWRQKIMDLPAVLVAPRVFEKNIVFDNRQGNLRKQGVLLRLRQQGGQAVLTVKTPVRNDSIYKVRNETEVQVSDFLAMEKMIRTIGFQVFFIYEKYREVFQAPGAQLMIDETPIGNFIEIEGLPETIDALAARLGFSATDYMTESYYQLFLCSGGAGNMVFVK